MCVLTPSFPSSAGTQGVLCYAFRCSVICDEISVVATCAVLGGGLMLVFTCDEVSFHVKKGINE